MGGMSNGTEQWCPVKRGGCISEVSFKRGFTVFTAVPIVSFLWRFHCTELSTIVLTVSLLYRFYSSTHVVSIVHVLYIHTDKKPTDIAISDVADMLQDKAFKLAVKLGVPFAVVKPLKKEEDGGMEALYLWLNGETKPPTPTTWRFFLETVKKITGSEQAEEIEQMAMEDPTWSESPS